MTITEALFGGLLTSPSFSRKIVHDPPYQLFFLMLRRYRPMSVAKHVVQARACSSYSDINHMCSHLCQRSEKGKGKGPVSDGKGPVK